VATGGGADSHVLREYLVALGFKIDESRARKADNFLVGLDKKAGRLGAALVGAGVAAVGLSVVFARSMERLFYNARYADTTVGRLQALEFAGRQIGLAGGEMTQGVKGFASALRANPGLVGMLEKLGVPVKGRQMDDVMWDFVRASKSMPFYVAQQFAEMFGMGPETLFNLQQGEEKGRAAAEQRKQMARDMGVDADALAEKMVGVSNTWDRILETTNLAASAIVANLLPQLEQFKDFSAGILKDWVGVSKEWSEHLARVGTEDFQNRMLEGLGLRRPGGDERGAVTLTAESQARIGALDDSPWPHWDEPLAAYRKRMIGRDRVRRKGIKADEKSVDAAQDTGAFTTGGTGAAGDVSPGGVDYANVESYEGAGDVSPGGVDHPGYDPNDPQAYLRDLERKYGLPPGLLDRVWSAESSRGRKMLSPAGAKGHFGFMGPTARAYGIEGQEGDFEASGDASARMWADMLKWSGGDLRKAAAGYNWGMGNVNKYGLGAAPAETRGYMDKTAGPEGGGVSVSTEIHIHGVSDPERAAESVVRRQRDVVSDVARNLGAKVK
jgi:hypothetical protein